MSHKDMVRERIGSQCKHWDGVTYTRVACPHCQRVRCITEMNRGGCDGCWLAWFYGEERKVA